MKDSKISLLLLVSLSMLLLAFVVLFIWGFTYYKQSIAVNQPSTIIISDSSAIAGDIRDSLQKLYTSTINRLYEGLDSTAKSTDSMQMEMDAKLREFITLKNEIGLILQNNSSPSEMGAAKAKLTGLQLKLEEWRTKYNDVNEENKRLSLLLRRLAQNTENKDVSLTKSVPVVSGNKVNIIPAKAVLNEQEPVNNIKSVTPAAEAKPNALFDVTNIQLKAMVKENDIEKETQQVLQADEIKGSFVVKNGEQSIKGAEIFIVVLQPDGKVIRQSSWESGLFESAQGRQIYSVKMRFDYDRGENKTINFSIGAERYQQGMYTVQVYYKGNLVGRSSKRLS